MVKVRVNLSLDLDIYSSLKDISELMHTTMSGFLTACIQVCEKEVDARTLIEKKIFSQNSNEEPL